MIEFYILSLKHSRLGAPLVWWGPGGRGYTRYMDEAGRYSGEAARACVHASPAACVVPAQRVARLQQPAPDRTLVTGDMRRPGAPSVRYRHLSSLICASLSPAPSDVGGAR